MSSWRARARALFDSPIVFWAVAVTLAIASIWSVSGVGDSDGADGGDRSILVADEDIAAGAPLTGAVSLRPWAGSVPADAISTEPEVGDSASAAIAAGEAVIERRTGRATGPAAGLDRSRRGVVVPTPTAAFAEVGQVDLIGSGDPLTGGGPTRVLAERAGVLAVLDDAIVVSLSHAESLEVVEAIVNGSVTVTLSGPSGD